MLRWLVLDPRCALPWCLAATAALGCHLRTAAPPVDAEPGPAPSGDQGKLAAPSVDAVLAASDLPATLEAPLPDDPMQVTVHRLKNGLTVYISTDRQKPRFNAWIGVRAGSRMDPPDSTGLAHYLEHMLFKGTDDFGTIDPKAEAPHVERVRELYGELRKAKDDAARKKILTEIDQQTQAMAAYAVPNEHSRMYGAMGIEGVNAFTSQEQTVYIGDVPSNRLNAWAAVEGERFADPVFRLFFPELEAVYEEKNLSLDNPGRRVSEALQAALFPKHPYGTQTTIGEVEHLKNPAYEDMVAYFDRWYVPNNMAIALAGDIDPERALPVLEEAFGRLRPKALSEPHAGELPPISGRVFREVRAEGEEGVTLAWHAVPAAHEDAVALEVMDRVLDDAKVGLLNVRLELTQRVPSAGSYLSSLREAGSFFVRADARSGQTPEELEAMLLEVVRTLREGEFTEEDVTAVKLQETVRLRRRLEFPGARVSKMMSAFIEHRDWKDVVEHDRRYQAVTRADVIRVAKKYLGDDYVVVAKRKGKPEIPKLDKPTITPVKIDHARRSAFSKKVEAMPVTELQPDWVKEGTHYVRRPLAAGPLIAAKNERNDLFSLTYSQERGYRTAPYLCYALELLDLSGAGDDDAEALQKQLYALGTSVSTSCGAEQSSITIEGIDGKMEESLAIVDRWVKDPRFDAEALDRLYDNTVSERRDGMEKDFILTMALSDYANLGKRSNWLQQPSNQRLAKAKPAELRRLIGTFFDHEHRTLYFGPRAVDEVAKVVPRGSKHRKVGAPELRRYVRVKEPTIYFLHKDGAKANVRFTIPRGVLARKDRPTARLLSEYLSGNMSALVFQEIRESRGLAYSAYSSYSVGRRPNDESGLFGMMSTQADKTPEAVRTFLDLLRSGEIQGERLTDAKAGIDQEYRATRIDPRWVTRWVVSWDDLGEKQDPRPWEWDTMKTLAVDDVAGFAKGFADVPVIITIVGDRERVGLEQLETIGKVREVEAADLFGYGAFPKAPGKGGEGGKAQPGGKGAKAGKPEAGTKPAGKAQLLEGPSRAQLDVIQRDLDRAR
jgi:predicted Zn-dependent peptidase